MVTMLTMFARTLVLCALLTLSGCGTLYLAQAARGQWHVMRERQPIDRVLADENTPEGLRARLAEVRDARDFASRELALPDNPSYRSYADVRRPFVVWNVVAAPELSVEPRKWCFPIVGCVAYRGYFNEDSARGFAAKLRRQGFDVTVGGVPAYSTLGRTADPVLNTMLRYGDTELAAIVFHELAHQVVYVAGDSSFNEAFAVTVEQAGLERWLRKRGRESELQRYLQQKGRQQEYIDLFMRYRARLAQVYSRKGDVQEKRTRKQAVLAELAADMRSLEERQAALSPYREWLKEGLNNAQLASVATYYDCVPGFEKLLADSGGEMPVFFASVRRIAGQPRAQHYKPQSPRARYKTRTYE
jgi:predicted aminopeptidase